MAKDAMKALEAHKKTPIGRAHPKGFKRGGVTSMDAKKYGRNMARVMNQRSPSK